MHRILKAVAAILLGVAVCACAPVDAPPVRAPDVELVPFAGGLRVVGAAWPKGTEIGFGRDWDSVRATMTALRGAPVEQVACGDLTAVRWRGVELIHDGKTFVGVGCSIQVQ